MTKVRAAFVEVRTFDHAAPVDDAALARYERNNAARSRLDPELKLIDAALQRWAPWARPHYQQLGYPTRSVTERANEGGLLARDFAVLPMPEWPAVVVAVDAQVARLPTRHQAAVMATYFHMALPIEQRQEVYARLVRYLARIRQQPLLSRRRPSAAADTAGADAYRRDLDRARWTLRHALQLG